ncbi:shewenella-like protein phosphatase 2 [Trifolium pratense]|uniref:Shewenella-like protein phosphatase 2 n=2 Tax=Trifolium pratense TaxID=57577 RepID=A0A2K3KFR8_TRIPR|nr:shewenella-like protein phosphatase 2 [Trifolium pratense]
MSKGCGGGLPEVLEIDRVSGVNILTSNSLYHQDVDVGKVEEGLGSLINNDQDVRPRQVEVKA